MLGGSHTQGSQWGDAVRRAESRHEDSCQQGDELLGLPRLHRPHSQAQEAPQPKAMALGPGCRWELVTLENTSIYKTASSSKHFMEPWRPGHAPPLGQTAAKHFLLGVLAFQWEPGDVTCRAQLCRLRGRHSQREVALEPCRTAGRGHQTPGLLGGMGLAVSSLPHQHCLQPHLCGSQAASSDPLQCPSHTPAAQGPRCQPLLPVQLCREKLPWPRTSDPHGSRKVLSPGSHRRPPGLRGLLLSEGHTCRALGFRASPPGPSPGPFSFTPLLLGYARRVATHSGGCAEGWLGG